MSGHSHTWTMLYSHLGPYGRHDVHTHACFECDASLFGPGRECVGNLAGHSQDVNEIPLAPVVASRFRIERSDIDGAETLEVKAGPRGTERIVPPAGRAYAFDREVWARRVVIYVSPTGRSVRVWVDGQEVK